MRFVTTLIGMSAVILFATSVSHADDDHQQAPRNIAVVSQFENTMYKIRVGLTVFNNTEQSREVDWHIAENSEADMVAFLKMKGVVGNIQPLTQTGPRARAGEGTDAEQAGIIQAARDAGFDTLVLIQPSDNINFRFFKPGYGVCGVGHIMGLDVGPYAAFMVVVYRTADAKRIDWRWGYRSMNSPFDFDSRGPCTDFEKYPVPWKDAITDYTDADLATIETSVKARIKAGIERALDGLDLQ